MTTVACWHCSVAGEPLATESTMLLLICGRWHESATAGYHGVRRLLSLRGRVASLRGRVVWLRGRVASLCERVASLRGRVGIGESIASWVTWCGSSRASKRVDALLRCRVVSSSRRALVASLRGRVSSVREREPSLRGRVVSVRGQVASLGVLVRRHVASRRVAAWSLRVGAYWRRVAAWARRASLRGCGAWAARPVGASVRGRVVRQCVGASRCVGA